MWWVGVESGKTRLYLARLENGAVKEVWVLHLW